MRVFVYVQVQRSLNPPKVLSLWMWGANRQIGQVCLVPAKKAHQVGDLQAHGILQSKSIKMQTHGSAFIDGGSCFLHVLKDAQVKRTPRLAKRNHIMPGHLVFDFYSCLAIFSYKRNLTVPSC